LLQEHGYTPDAARAAALTLLPNILTYDRASVHLPQRRVDDDVFATRMAYLTNGKFGPSGVKPHADLQVEFPSSACRIPRNPARPTTKKDNGQGDHDAGAETDILTTVLDAWKSAVDAHDPKRVATYFTDDAIFQGLHPYSVGRTA